MSFGRAVLRTSAAVTVPLDGYPSSDDPAATRAAAVPLSGWESAQLKIGVKRRTRRQGHRHCPTSADTPRPAHMGSNPAVGLLARGLGALAFPGSMTQWLYEDPSPLTVAGTASDLQASPAHRIPCYPLAGTVGLFALANHIWPVEPWRETENPSGARSRCKVSALTLRQAAADLLLHFARVQFRRPPDTLGAFTPSSTRRRSGTR